MTDHTVDVAAFLEGHEQDVLKAAHETVGRAHLAHYDAAGPAASTDRLNALLQVVISGCRRHDLSEAASYAD